jgi:hypothetical protein
MDSQDAKWHIVCDVEVAERCRNDEKFPYIVALARSVNALLYALSIMEYVGKRNDPSAMRDRFNSYLFGTGIMYEALNLIRAMGKTFQDDDLYQNGLQLILTDKRAQQIEQEHMNPARNAAIFHFDHERFAEVIGKSRPAGFAFFSGQGNNPMNVNFSYSDTVTAEIPTGLPSGTEEFFSVLGAAMNGTRELVRRFANEATNLIMPRLKHWGFKRQNDEGESSAG